jgi:hypothetical protein
MGCDSEYFHVFQRLTFDALAFGCDKELPINFANCSSPARRIRTTLPCVTFSDKSKTT